MCHNHPFSIWKVEAPKAKNSHSASGFFYFFNFLFDAITRSFWHIALWPCNVSCINITFKLYTFQKFPQILKMTDVTEIKQPLAFIRPNDHMRCFWLGFLIPRVINIKGTVDARWSTNQVTRHDCCRPPYDLHVGAIPLHHPLAARCHIW